MQQASWVGGVAFSPDNKYLFILGGRGGTLHTWDLQQKSHVRSHNWFKQINIKDSRNYRARGFSISNDGNRLAISIESGTFVFVDPSDPNFYMIPKKLSDVELTKIIISKDFLVTGSAKGEILLIDISSAPAPCQVDKIYQDENHEMIRGIAVSPNGNLLSFTNSDGLLNMIELNDSHLTTIKAHNGHAIPVCFLNSDRFLATGTQDNIICVWDYMNGDIKKLFESWCNILSVKL